MAKMYIILTICVIVGVLISVSAFAGIDKSNSPKFLGIPLWTTGENPFQRTVNFVAGIIMAVTFMYIIGKFAYLDNNHNDIPQYHTPMLTREEREYQQWLARYRNMVGIVPDEYIPEKAKKALEAEGYVFE